LCAEYGVVLYLPFDHTDPLAHADVPNTVVYERDRKQVITSDFILMLCTSASYGAGQENEIAAENGVPVAYLVPKGCKVSRMLLGSDTRKAEIRYDGVDNLELQIREFLEGTAPALRERRAKLGVPEPLGIGSRILFLGVDMAYLLLGATASLDERMRRSLDHLKTVARDEDMSFQDYEQLWDGYVKNTRTNIGFVAATRNVHVIGKEQWRDWYRRLTEKRGGIELQF
jgi:hypothetical protein